MKFEMNGIKSFVSETEFKEDNQFYMWINNMLCQFVWLFSEIYHISSDINTNAICSIKWETEKGKKSHGDALNRDDQGQGHQEKGSVLYLWTCSQLLFCSQALLVTP